MPDQFTRGSVEIARQHLNNPSVGDRLREGVMNADAQSQMHYQQQWVDRMITTIARPNTKLAYEPKQAEFLEFCDELYARDPVPRHINFDKVYRFLFYVCHRQKRKRGKKKSQANGNLYFNLAEYQQVWETRRGAAMSTDDEDAENAPHRIFEQLPTDAPQWNVFNQYRCAIKKLHDHNLKNKLTAVDWNQEIWTPWCKDLETIVKQRKILVNKALYKEKMNSDFTLLKGKGRDKEIEEMMWRDGFTKSNLRNTFPSIR